MILPWREVSIDGGRPISTSLTADETEALRQMAEGKRVLEIGSAFGYSTVVMALGAVHIDAVDPHEAHGSERVMRSNLRAYGVENKVTVHLATSATAELEGNYDSVFIDGDHTEEGVTHDVHLAMSLGASVIACHDYGEDSCPGVRKALDRLFPEGPDTLIDTLFVTVG